MWILPHVVHMSVASMFSSRVVQKCLEQSGSMIRDRLLAALLPGTLDLYTSEHGNFVLAKAIEVAPRPHLRPIIELLEQEGACVVAKHRYGCRILERLIEHGEGGQMSVLIDQFIEYADDLSRHQYGNFVIQSVLEHGTEVQGKALLQALIPHVPHLAMHRSASHVVQKAINHCSEQGQRAIAHALLHGCGPHTFLDVASSRYGSYVVGELQEICCLEAEICEARQILKKAVVMGSETDSPHLFRTASKFGVFSEDKAAPFPVGIP